MKIMNHHPDSQSFLHSGDTRLAFSPEPRKPRGPGSRTEGQVVPAAEAGKKRKADASLPRHTAGRFFKFCFFQHPYGSKSASSQHCGKFRKNVFAIASSCLKSPKSSVSQRWAFSRDALSLAAAGTAGGQVRPAAGLGVYPSSSPLGVFRLGHHSHGQISHSKMARERSDHIPPSSWGQNPLLGAPF